MPNFMNKMSQTYQLTYHQWAEPINRPRWPYIGRYRFRANGEMHGPTALSIQAMSAPGMAFVWSMDYQAAAVRAGFFLHRSGDAERVNVIGVNPNDKRFPTADGFACIRTLERLDFEQPLTIYWRALKFIRQQDQYGYTGAWERAVMFYSPKLAWYKTYHAMSTPAQELSRRDTAIMRKEVWRRKNIAKAREHAFASHVKRNYILKQPKQT